MFLVTCHVTLQKQGATTRIRNVMLSLVPTLKDEKIKTHQSHAQKMKLELKMSGNPRTKENKASIGKPTYVPKKSSLNYKNELKPKNQRKQGLHWEAHLRAQKNQA